MHITQVVLQASDLSSLKDFYGGLLQLKVDMEGDILVVHAGSSQLCFSREEGSKAFYHFAFTIPAFKIEEARQWMENKRELLFIEDYQSVVADFVNWDSKSIYFTDPMGNIVEAISRHGIPNEDPSPFGPQHFLSISEIGLVFPEEKIGSETDALLNRFPIQYFRRQPPFPKFKALGDDHGLFIIVTEGRDWYPTSRKAGQFPLKVDFILDQQAFQLRM